MNHLNGAFLAGFIAGEGHFSIRPNNAGQSWACGFHLVQREDNAELVVAAREAAGVGSISSKAARHTSRPQVVWTVQTIEDCFALVGLLDSLPLLGKKAGDFRIWRMAVARWAQLQDGRARWPHLRELAGTLRTHRQPRYAFDYTGPAISQEYLESFLAGFSSAEGHYGASQEGHPRFAIKLRADDSGVLAVLASRFRVGRLARVPPRHNARPQTIWLVTRLAELRSLVAVFDRHPPHGRAGYIYAPWRQLVLSTDRKAAVRRSLAAQIRATRQCLGSQRAAKRPPPRKRRREVYLSALRRWAGTTHGRFTAPAYASWRREVDPAAPDRNTLARTFGSWRAAMIAAGIPTDRSRPTTAIARCRQGAANRRLARRIDQREAILHSVKQCSTALGRPPAATEYMSWRLQADPGSPSQATVYRHFPGGWQSVLAALDARFT
jgi:hypothetical protein